jgi:hypothetical protein
MILREKKEHVRLATELVLNFALLLNDRRCLEMVITS